MALKQYKEKKNPQRMAGFTWPTPISMDHDPFPVVTPCFEVCIDRDVGDPDLMWKMEGKGRGLKNLHVDA